MLSTRDYFNKLSKQFKNNVEEQLEEIGIKKLIVRKLLEHGFEIPEKNIEYYPGSTLLFVLKNVKVDQHFYALYVEVPLISFSTKVSVSKVTYNGYQSIYINKYEDLLYYFEDSINKVLKDN